MLFQDAFDRTQSGLGPDWAIRGGYSADGNAVSTGVDTPDRATAVAAPVRAGACVGRTLYVGYFESPDQLLVAHILAVFIDERTGTTESAYVGERARVSRAKIRIQASNIPIRPNQPRQKPSCCLFIAPQE